MVDCDPRAEERNNLKLALATFALQRDEFEAGIRIRSLMTGTQVSKLAAPGIGLTESLIEPPAQNHSRRVGKIRALDGKS
jgi:hypothetical protein